MYSHNENYMKFLQKTENRVTNDPAISFQVTQRYENSLLYYLWEPSYSINPSAHQNIGGSKHTKHTYYIAFKKKFYLRKEMYRIGEHYK
jgi:hypothetical protein